MNNTMNNSIIINFLKEQMKIHKVENSIIILPKNIEILDNLTEKTINNEYKIINIDNEKDEKLIMNISVSPNKDNSNDGNNINDNESINSIKSFESLLTNYYSSNDKIKEHNNKKTYEEIKNKGKNFIKENKKNVRRLSIQNKNKNDNDKNNDNDNDKNNDNFIKKYYTSKIRSNSEPSTSLLADCEISNLNNSINYFIKQVSNIIINQSKIDINDLSQKNFINTFNHQVKTPLNGLALGIQILDETCKSEFHKSIINNLFISCIELSKYVNDIIEYYLLLHNKIKFNYSKFNINEVIKECIEYYKTTIKLNKISLKIKTNKEFPNTICSDKKMIKQIINNLLGNSIKFTHNNSVQINIDYLDDNIIIKIHDNGIGIPQEDKKKLFQPFFQSNDSNNTPDGLGLGLSNSKLIIEKLKGTIEFIDSKFKTSIQIKFPNNLTSLNDIIDDDYNITNINLDSINLNEFDLAANLLSSNKFNNDNMKKTYPAEMNTYFSNINNRDNNRDNNKDIYLVNDINKEEENQNKKRDINNKKRSMFKSIRRKSQNETKNKCNFNINSNSTINNIITNNNKNEACYFNKILLVDDNTNNLNLLKCMIDSFCNSCITIIDKPEDVYDTITENDFDIIFLDIKMPRISGYQILDKLKENYPEKMTNIYILSAILVNDIQDKINGNYNIKGIISKPIQLSEIKKILVCP